MTLYHDSTIAVDEPRILESDVGRDFGFAFYSPASLKFLKFIRSYELEVEQ